MDTDICPDFVDKLGNPDPCQAARALLGAVLLTPVGLVRLAELEAYGGPNDKGSHAYRGRTPRNQIMFEQPGSIYMYLCYGMHWMLNIVCCPIGQAGAVLVRGVQPLDSIPSLRPGPGNVAKALGLNRSHYGLHILDIHSKVRLVDSQPPTHVMQGRRIGINVGHSDELAYRFWDHDQIAWVSAHKQGSPVNE